VTLVLQRHDVVEHRHQHPRKVLVIHDPDYQVFQRLLLLLYVPLFKSFLNFRRHWQVLLALLLKPYLRDVKMAVLLLHWIFKNNFILAIQIYLSEIIFTPRS